MKRKIESTRLEQKKPRSKKEKKGESTLWSTYPSAEFFTSYEHKNGETKRKSKLDMNSTYPSEDFFKGETTKQYLTKLTPRSSSKKKSNTHWQKYFPNQTKKNTKQPKEINLELATQLGTKKNTKQPKEINLELATQLGITEEEFLDLPKDFTVDGEKKKYTHTRGSIIRRLTQFIFAFVVVKNSTELA